MQSFLQNYWFYFSLNINFLTETYKPMTINAGIESLWNGPLETSLNYYRVFFI